MKRSFSYFVIISFFIVVIAGCTQIKQFAPQPIETQYTLPGMPADLVRVQVDDLRAEKENSAQLTQAIKGQILSALSTEKIAGNLSFHSLQVDVIEHHSFFKFGTWKALTKLRIKLIDSNSNIIGNWSAEGNARRLNVLGNASAKAASQDAYTIAISDMMSTLSAVSIVK